MAKVAVPERWGSRWPGRRRCWGCGRAPTEAAKFWLHLRTELKNRGVRDIFIGGVDGRKGFPETMEAAWPARPGQLRLGPRVRHSLSYAGGQAGKAVAVDLKTIYRATTVAEAAQALAAFAAKADLESPRSARVGARIAPESSPFLKYAAEIHQANLYDQCD